MSHKYTTILLNSSQQEELWLPSFWATWKLSAYLQLSGGSHIEWALKSTPWSIRIIVWGAGGPCRFDAALSQVSHFLGSYTSRLLLSELSWRQLDSCNKTHSLGNCSFQQVQLHQTPQLGPRCFYLLKDHSKLDPHHLAELIFKSSSESEIHLYLQAQQITLPWCSRKGRAGGLHVFQFWMVFKIALLSFISYCYGHFLVSGYYKEVKELTKVFCLRVPCGYFSLTCNS